MARVSAPAGGVLQETCVYEVKNVPFEVIQRTQVAASKLAEYIHNADDACVIVASCPGSKMAEVEAIFKDFRSQSGPLRSSVQLALPERSKKVRKKANSCLETGKKRAPSEANVARNKGGGGSGEGEEGGGRGEGGGRVQHLPRGPFRAWAQANDLGIGGGGCA